MSYLHILFTSLNCCQLLFTSLLDEMFEKHPFSFRIRIGPLFKVPSSTKRGSTSVGSSDRMLSSCVWTIVSIGLDHFFTSDNGSLFFCWSAQSALMFWWTSWFSDLGVEKAVFYTSKFLILLLPALCLQALHSPLRHMKQELVAKSFIL